MTTHSRHYVGKDGVERTYTTHLLRRSYRQDGRSRNETLANLSHLPEPIIANIRAGLEGQTLVPAGAAVEITRSVAHGHVAAVWAMARRLGLAALLGPACRARDVAVALIIARAVAPASKLATLSWWADTTLGQDLGVADAGTDEVYTAMDWLVARQDLIQQGLAAKHLAGPANPSGMGLVDLSSSWVHGRACPLAKHGYSRDGKKGLAQIEYALLTDPAGRPVAVHVFEGNTADPAAFTHTVTTIRDSFGLRELVLVGDRGMITSARIAALRQDTDLGWVTALRAPAIAALAADGGPLQPTLFDEMNLAEISHPDYPAERLIACRNPLLAAERARKRAELLEATSTLLAPVVAAVAAGRLTGADRIGLRVGKLIDRYKMAKHFTTTITDTSVSITPDQAAIAAEAALDGLYVIRTSVPADTLDGPAVVGAYKNLAHVERDFRSMKTTDLDLRPIHHRLTDRVKAHVFIVMLAAYLTWHLRQAWAPLTYTDEHPPARPDPVAPATRSADADRKAAAKTSPTGIPVRSYQALLAHLGTLTRNDLRFGGPDGPTIPTLATPTPAQRAAFELIGAPIPATLTLK